VLTVLTAQHFNRVLTMLIAQGVNSVLSE